MSGAHIQYLSNGLLWPVHIQVDLVEVFVKKTPMQQAHFLTCEEGLLKGKSPPMSPAFLA